MAEKDKYTRGKSGYSVADEKAAKDYGRQDYKETRDSPTPQKERKYRRDVGGPQNYLHNTKSEHGRKVNEKNVAFMSDEAQAARRKKNEDAASGKTRLTVEDKKY
jgi:hypothetical protein